MLCFKGSTAGETGPKVLGRDSGPHVQSRLPGYVEAESSDPAGSSTPSKADEPGRNEKRSGGSRCWLSPGQSSSSRRSLPGLQHSRARPRLEEQGLLELNPVRIQLDLGVVNDSTEVKLHLAAALLQNSVSWFRVWLDHLLTGEGIKIKPRKPG